MNLLLLPVEQDYLAGYEDIRQFFVQRIAEQNFANAYLFSGPGKCGKATLAYRVMRSIILCTGSRNHASGIETNRTKSNNFDARDEIQLQAGNLLLENEWKTVTGAARSRLDGNIVVLDNELVSGDDKKNNKKKRFEDKIIYPLNTQYIRDLRKLLGQKQYTDTYRCVLIDKVDDLNAFAKNALLKLLEEPPQNVIFFLLADSAMNVPVTIASRCQRFSLPPLNISSMKQLFDRYKGGGSQENRYNFTSMVRRYRNRPGYGLVCMQDNFSIENLIEIALADLDDRRAIKKATEDITTQITMSSDSNGAFNRFITILTREHIIEGCQKILASAHGQFNRQEFVTCIIEDWRALCDEARISRVIRLLRYDDFVFRAFRLAIRARNAASQVMDTQNS